MDYYFSYLGAITEPFTYTSNYDKVKKLFNSSIVEQLAPDAVLLHFVIAIFRKLK